MPSHEPLDPQDPLGIGTPSPAPAAGPKPAQDELRTIDVVSTVGALDRVVVTLRDFVHRSGAIRAVALLPAASAEDPPNLVDCARLAPIEVTSAGRTVHLPHTIDLRTSPLPLYDVRMLPPFEVHPQDARIAAPLGGMEHYGFAVRSLATALGDGVVALITFTTTEPEAPLSLTARRGDPIVISLGDEEYEMPPDWPETLPASSDEEQ